MAELIFRICGKRDRRFTGVRIIFRPAEGRARFQ